MVVRHAITADQQRLKLLLLQWVNLTRVSGKSRWTHRAGCANLSQETSGRRVDGTASRPCDYIGQGLLPSASDNEQESP
jgi:hypothetical protein